MGLATKNPAAGLAAGICSHLIADCLPHLDLPPGVELVDGQYDKPKWDKKLIIFALTDSLLAFFITLFIWYKFFDLSLTSPFAWGALGGYLPDLIDNPPWWRDLVRTVPGLKQFHSLHQATHNLWRFRYPMPNYWLLGIITQIIFVAPSLWFIVR